MKILLENIKLGKPANRTLKNAGIESIDQLTSYSEKDLLSLHGFGPKALGILKTVMQQNDLLLEGELRMNNNQVITIEATINAPIEKVWHYWTEPEHIKQWNSASDDWHTTAAENDLRVGGKFLSRMEAKDGSFGFDFSGIYDEINLHETIAYTLGDERKVSITFHGEDNKTKVIEAFDAENTNSLEMQKSGWQSILDHFKNYVEGL
jgi:uncharacterized protein YndB with AHSA1/START domain